MRTVWARLSARERAIFCLTVAVLGVALVWQFAVRPYEAALESVRDEIAAKEARLARLERGPAKPASAAPAAGSPEQEMSRLLKAVESMARASSIRITDLKPLPTASKGGYQEVRVELQTQASMEQLSRFLYRLQTSPLALDVPRFSLGAPEAPGDFKLKLSLTVVRAVLPAETAPKASRVKVARGL